MGLTNDPTIQIMKHVLRFLELGRGHQQVIAGGPDEPLGHRERVGRLVAVGDHRDVELPEGAGDPLRLEGGGHRGQADKGNGVVHPGRLYAAGRLL